MKLRPRLTLFTISIILAVVFFTSLSTVVSLRFLLRREMRANQLTWFNNFRRACLESVRLGDDLAVQAYSESLEKSIPELAYAVLVDSSRGVRLGGMESLQRFAKLKPDCPSDTPSSGVEPSVWDVRAESENWRHICDPVVQSNARGNRIQGTVHVGFNMNMLEWKLQAVVRRIWPSLMWAMLSVLFVGVVVAFLLARKLTRPILHLTEGAKAIGEGRLDTQIPVESSDELGFLAQEFNLMATKLRELDQLKDDFVSSVSHELRSPLAAISGYVELLRNKPLEEISPDKREKALKIIQESSNRLAQFINDILDLAKLKSGHVELRRRPLDIRHEAEEIVTLFHPLLEKKGIQASLDVPGNIPVLYADAEKIRQVITNLFSNALKFTPAEGKIRLSARNQTDFVQISVADTGVGIPPDSKQAVFERFKQVKNTKSPLEAGQKGTGLGLAIAKGNVELHGGRIWLESELNKGTTVHFTLPVRPLDSGRG